MNIIQTFLDLTDKTYPHGTEHLLERFLPKDINKDRFGNYFLKIGDSRVIFASHLDTVSGSYMDVKHTFSDCGKIVGTDGTTTLGADDKAGVVIMLNMIENRVPGLYYFFVGEEVGCIGSGKVSREVHIFNKLNYDKVISFDRRGNNSVITHQSLVRTCSKEFADSLVSEFNDSGCDLKMECDDTGVCTDSIEFIDEIPECTNISVGYLNEHSGDEIQDLEFLEMISKSCTIIDWEGLPTKRDPSVTEYKKTRTYNSLDDWENWNFNGGNNNNDNDDEYNRRLSIAYGYGDMDDEFGIDDVDVVDVVDSNPFNHSCMNSCNHNSNKFFDSLDVLGIEDVVDKNNYFESLKDKYMDDRLTDNEIKIIIDTMLDMDDPSDNLFAEEMESMIRLKNWGELT